MALSIAINDFLYKDTYQSSLLMSFHVSHLNTPSTIQDPHLVLSSKYTFICPYPTYGHGKKWKIGFGS